MKSLTLYCDHPTFTGAEGPIASLGRYPILWTCDTCHEMRLIP